MTGKPSRLPSCSPRRASRTFARALIEKDYWVTHTLDALKRAGFVVHFKGGTF